MVVFLLLTLYTSCVVSYPSPIIYVNKSNDAVDDPSCWTGGVAKPCYSINMGLQGLHTNRQGTLLIAEAEYTLSRSNYTDFQGMNNLSIQGVTHPMSRDPQVLIRIRCQGDGVGLSFTKVSNIAIGGVTFNECGALRKTTSFNMDEDHPDFLLMHVTLYFLYCMNVNVTFVEVFDTPGTGMVMYNTIGTNIIHNSTFAGNIFLSSISHYSGGGGLTIEFTYCDILTNDCLYSNNYIDHGYNKASNYQITQCYFQNNVANLTTNITSLDSFILPHGRYHVALGRGGGLSVYFLGNADGNTITLNNCTFSDNQAIWAGGLLVEFHDSALNNVFLANNTVFERNIVHISNKRDGKGTGGGGARVAMFDFNSSVILNNHVVFNECQFDKNNAYYGAGFSFYTTTANNSNSLQFVSCNFSTNEARLGAAFDVSLFHLSKIGQKPKVTVEDCRFSDNRATNLPGLLVGAGSVYVDSISILFIGLVLFKGNDGTALTVTDTHIEVDSQCSLQFINNTGRHGGGMGLVGKSHILIHPNSSFLFQDNAASLTGGAIYYTSSGERDLIGSGNCFIQYSDLFQSQNKWLTRFEFENNTANNRPNSIYASTILPCIHGGEDWNISIGAQNVFCWNDNWTYNGSSSTDACQSQITTAANDYSVNTSYSVIPGDVFNLNASATDDNGNPNIGNVLFLLKIRNDTNGNFSFERNQSVNYDFVSHGHVRLYGKPNTTLHITIETLDPIVIQNHFNVTLLECPPGYSIPDSPGDQPLGCECIDAPNLYFGYVRCIDNFTSTIIRTGWIGKYPNHTELLAGASPYIASISNLTHIPLPQNTSELDLFFCNKSNSHGILCGSCQQGYGVSAASFEFIDTPCIHCPPSKTHAMWMLYILAGFIPTLIFFCIVFIFNMSVTSGPLNSFIFFAQIINTVAKINANGMIPLVSKKALMEFNQFYFFVYNIWNMKFFDSWLLDFCVSPHMNSLSMLILGYIRAIFPLVLLICVFSVVYLYNRGVPFVVYLFRPLHRCLARFRQFSNLRNSIIGGIAVFIVISYTQITLISFMVLAPANLYNSAGHVVKKVFMYNGNIPYDWNSFRYFVPAVVAVCVFVVAPPVLFAYPSLLKLVAFISCNRIRLEKLYPTPRLQALLNEFHGCYKDGSDGESIDCRWFASLYFILRVGLVVVYSTTNTWHLQYTEQIFLFLIVAFLFATLRPYRNQWINVLDTAMFLLLAAICTLSFFNLTNTWIGRPLNEGVVVFQQVLVGMPLLYCIIYCSVMLYNARPCCKAVDRRRRIHHNAGMMPSEAVKSVIIDDETVPGDAHQREEGTFTPTSMFDDSTHVSEFLDFIEESGRSETISERRRHSSAASRQLPKPRLVTMTTGNSSINSSTCNSRPAAGNNESTALLGNKVEPRGSSRGFVKSLLWYRRNNKETANEEEHNTQ